MPNPLSPQVTGSFKWTCSGSPTSARPGIRSLSGAESEAEGPTTDSTGRQGRSLSHHEQRPGAPKPLGRGAKGLPSLCPPPGPYPGPMNPQGPTTESTCHPTPSCSTESKGPTLSRTRASTTESDPGGFPTHVGSRRELYAHGACRFLKIVVDFPSKSAKMYSCSIASRAGLETQNGGLKGPPKDLK